CSLHCRHCRAAACADRNPLELDTESVRATIQSIARHYSPIIILTGGEPLLRPDLFEIIQESVKAGLRTVMATCGVGLDESLAQRLKQAGIARLSFSLDGDDAVTHDAFRQVPGAFEACLNAMRSAREVGLSFQVNTTVTRTNMSRLDQIWRKAVDLGAAAFHPFLLVPTGRGKEIRDEVLSAAEYERVLHHIAQLSLKSPIPFKPTCAPHYCRILGQVNHGVSALDSMTRGCLGGIGFAFISHIGKVQICGFLEEEAGDLRTTGFDFGQIWETSPLFLSLRDKSNYRGKCSRCEFWHRCGGCRARAFAMTGDWLASEPCCDYIPAPETTRGTPA
ncbi:MAG TPA: radical SAM protein, partial [bacterium]|nr:radical SAM protein [bacterium]